MPRNEKGILKRIGDDEIVIVCRTKLGINVLNCPTHNLQAIAELTIALMFGLQSE